MAHSAYEVLNKAWTTTTTSNGKWKYRTLGQSDGSHTTNTLVTPAIDSTAKLSGNKILVYLVINAVASDVAADMFMEVSADGTNFSAHHGTGTNYITVSSDIEPNSGTVTKVYMVDLTSYTVPYFRIGINSAGLNLGSGFKCQLGFAYPVT
jgi:hypothetical protein|tara:strand:+ start:415 stop:867 length:453 start_codon:yes stop_codon:yes gene_type:complete